MEGQKEWLPAVIDGALGNIPAVGGVAANTFGLWRKKNVDKAREVLLSNIRQGDVEAVHQDELFSMLARFSRSVQEGIAKQNLVLMARLISGIGKVDKKSGRADTFNQYADMLESLTEEEIRFLAFCIRSGKIQQDEELLQSLQYKGFFTSQLQAEIKTKKGVVIRTGPPIPNTAKTAADLHDAEPRPAPYDIQAVPVYSRSSKFKKLLDTYGNLWDEISKWADKKEIND